MKQVRVVIDNKLKDFEDKIRNASWDMMDENNADRAYDKFHNHFQHFYNEAMPVKNKNNKLYHNRYNPWITHGILNTVYVKNWLYTKKFKPKLWSPSKIYYL